MDFALFGDIGGHKELFEQSLIDLGCNVEAGIIPDDITIVQVGDLVDRGPDSNGVVDLVNKFIASDRWIQLVGNHEQRMLIGPNFDTPRSLSEPDEEHWAIIQTWRERGWLHLACGIEAEDGEQYFITHAGLSMQFWAINYDREEELSSLVELVNRHWDISTDEGWYFGVDTRRPQYPGVTWANCRRDLLPSWFEGNLPWNQVHGHSTLLPWGNMRDFVRPDNFEHVTYDLHARHSWMSYPNDKKIIQIDPALGTYSGFAPVPYMVRNVTQLHI